MRIRHIVKVISLSLIFLFVGGDPTLSAELAEESAAERKPLFGGESNVQYASALWESLRDANLVGENAIFATPYVGQEPHGAILITLEAPVTVEDHTAVALVKKNYVGENVTKDSVANNPRQNLASITVMYRREQGYDPDHDNWFWAKYNADGSLQENPKEMPLAGRVAKGTNQGCIACHQAAPGQDYVFNHNRLAETPAK